MRINISGENIHRYRVEFGISEQELADKMCVLGRETTETRIIEMEKGTCKVYDIDLVVIEAILHRSIEELLQ